MAGAGTSLNVQQVHDTLLEFERDEGLFEWRIRGEAYWHLIRHNLFGRLLLLLGLHGRRPTGPLSRPFSAWLAAMRSEFDGGLEGLRRHDWSDLGPADLLVFNHERHLRCGDQWICPYTHPLLEDSAWSRVVIQDTHEGRHLRPAPPEGLRYLAGNLGRQWASSAALRLLRPGPGGLLLDRSGRNQVRYLATLLGRLFGVEVPSNALLATVQGAVFELVARAALYDRLLDRVRPRAVIVVVGYGYRCLPLVAAARRRSVPTIELQHGMIGPTHLAYNYAPGVRPEGFPDYLLTFGEFWRKSARLPLPRTRTPALGFAWLDRHRIPRQDTERAWPRRILVLSQGTIGAELSRLVVEIANLLPPDRYHLRYKLHPGEIPFWRERYPWLARSGLEVVDHPTTIYGELAAADIQIAVYSTAMYEGLAYGLTTFIARLPGHEHAAPLVAAGAAVAFDTAEELVDALASASQPPPALSAELFRPGARERFAAILDGILASGEVPRDFLRG